MPFKFAADAVCLTEPACCCPLLLVPDCGRGSGLRAPGSGAPLGDRGLLDLAVKAEARWVGDKGFESACGGCAFAGANAGGPYHQYSVFAYKH